MFGFIGQFRLEIWRKFWIQINDLIYRTAIFAQLSFQKLCVSWINVGLKFIYFHRSVETCFHTTEEISHFSHIFFIFNIDAIAFCFFPANVALGPTFPATFSKATLTHDAIAVQNEPANLLITQLTLVSVLVDSIFHPYILIIVNCLIYL